MNRRLFYNILFITFLIGIAIDFPAYDSSQEENSIQYAGVNGKQLQKVANKSWKWLKSCSGRKTQISNKSRIYSILHNGSQIHAAETLVKEINNVKSQEEILPKIGDYLSQSKPNVNGWKVINCVKDEANEVRMYLYERGKLVPTKEKIIRIATKSVNLAEYDVYAMQENYYKGYDGIEYVEFIIPKRAQYILNGQYNNRLYECMVFNVPKDINGNWERFKEYLIAFLDDLMNRPFQLWDEYMFRRGLAELKINDRDVKEMERYIFAHIKNENNEITKYLYSKIA